MTTLTQEHSIHAVLAGLAHGHPGVQDWVKREQHVQYASTTHKYSLSQTLASSTSRTIHSATVKLGPSVVTECPGLEVRSEVIAWKVSGGRGETGCEVTTLANPTYTLAPRGVQGSDHGK